jgi:hypothetical protein
MKFHIGGDLESRWATVIKSSLTVQSESWDWVTDIDEADVWIVIPNDSTLLVDLSERSSPHIVFVDNSLPLQCNKDNHHLLPSPMRGAKLIRLLDQIVAQIKQTPINKATQTPPVPEPMAPPVDSEANNEETQPSWRGKNIKLGGSPKLSRFPVTAELTVWLHQMATNPVSYDEMVTALPMDKELIETVLNKLANDGILLDEAGSVLTPFKANQEGSLLGKLWGKKPKK